MSARPPVRPDPTPDNGGGSCETGLNRLYSELRELAARQLSHQRSDHTLPATALVHEVYLRLAPSRMTEAVGRADLLRLASKAMRSVLVDHARRHGAAKRKTEGERVSLDTVAALYEHSAIDLIALDEALTRLADLEPRWAAIIELRFFGGCTEEEIGGLLEISTRTVERDWQAAKAWLRQAIEGNQVP